MAEKGVRKGRCPSLATSNDKEQRLRRLLHLQEHGAGADLPHQHAEYPTKDPHYRILAHQRSRFTHYYFYIRDEVLRPMVIRVASFLLPDHLLS